MPDVDIDFYDRENTLKLFKHTPASMIKDVEIGHGRTVKLSEISKKRLKRRTIQLVRKPI